MQIEGSMDININPITAPYFKQYAELERDQDVRKYFSNPIERSREETIKLLESGAGKNILIVTRTGGEFIGYCGFIPHKLEAEIYIILARKHWNNGYAKKAIKKMVEISKYDTLIAIINPRHERSIKVFEKMGFERAGAFVSESWQNGHIKYKYEKVT